MKKTKVITEKQLISLIKKCIKEARYSKEDVARAHLDAVGQGTNDDSGFAPGQLAMMAQSDNDYDRKFAQRCKSNNFNRRRDYDEGYWMGQWQGDLDESISRAIKRVLK